MPIWVKQDPEYLKEEDATGAFSTLELEEEELGSPYVHPKTGEHVVIIGHRTGGETVAHELGHVALGHSAEQFETPENVAKGELSAWLWAQKKRGKPIRAPVAKRLVTQLSDQFPNMTDDDIIRTVQESYYDVGEEPPSEEYLRRYLEYLESD